MEHNCKRCLLSDLTGDDYFNNIYAYIASLDENAKVTDELYRKRLSICLACSHLINGMCSLCGCFAEVRAVKKDSYCAKSRDIW